MHLLSVYAVIVTPSGHIPRRLRRSTIVVGALALDRDPAKVEVVVGTHTGAAGAHILEFGTVAYGSVRAITTPHPGLQLWAGEENPQ